MSLSWFFEFHVLTVKNENWLDVVGFQKIKHLPKEIQATY